MEGIISKLARETIATYMLKLPHTRHKNILESHGYKLEIWILTVGNRAEY